MRANVATGASDVVIDGMVIPVYLVGVKLNGKDFTEYENKAFAADDVEGWVDFFVVEELDNFPLPSCRVCRAVKRVYGKVEFYVRDKMVTA